MAKWGEGDPRWLVECRADGHNVNGWHWEEKNKLEWSRARLRDLFHNLCSTAPDNSSDGCRIEDICLKDLSGEVAITTRKGGKKFPVYDLKITLEWVARTSVAEEEIKGEVKVEEFASHSDADDYIVTITSEKSGEAQEKCKAVLAAMKPVILELLEQYKQDLNAL